MGRFSKARGTVTALLMVAIAGSAWLLVREALSFGGASRRGVIFNPGYQHAKRLQVATSRAAMDVLGMKDSAEAAAYQTDYRLQRMQIQADSMGLDRWAAHDVQRQGLIKEIRASLTEFTSALNRASTPNATGVQPAAPALLPSLQRAQTALSNYAASFAEPMRQTSQPPANYLFTQPVVLWWLLLLILVELAILAWVVFSPKGGWKGTI